MNHAAKKTISRIVEKKHFLDHQLPFSSFRMHITVKNRRKWIKEGQNNNEKDLESPT